MPYVLKRVKGAMKGAYYEGLGTKKSSSFADACWNRTKDSDTVYYQSEEEAIEAAKVLFPDLLYRRMVAAVRETP